MKIRTKIKVSLLVCLSFNLVILFFTFQITYNLRGLAEKINQSKDIILATKDLGVAVEDHVLTYYKVMYYDQAITPKELLLSEKNLIKIKLQDLNNFVDQKYNNNNIPHERKINNKDIYKLIDSYRSLDVVFNDLKSETGRLSVENTKQRIYETSENYYLDFQKNISRVVDNENNEIANLSKERDLGLTFFKKFMLAFAFFSMAIILGIMFWIIKTVINPILQLEKATDKISSGDFEVSLDDAGTSEIAMLTKGFNKMALALKANQKSIAIHQQTIFEAAKMNSIAEMAKGIAYEINTPLKALILNTELLEMRNLKFQYPNPDITTMVNAMLATENKIDSIIKGLMGVTKEADHNDQDYFSCKNLIENTLNLCNEMIKKNHIEIIVNPNFLEYKLRGNINLLVH